MENNIQPTPDDILQQILAEFDQAAAYIEKMEEDQNGINSDNSKIASKITVLDKHERTVVTKGGGVEHEIYYTSHQVNRYTPTQIKAFEQDRDAKEADYQNEQALLNALPPVTSLIDALLESLDSQDGQKNDPNGNTGYQDFRVASKYLSQIFRAMQNDLKNDAASQVLHNDARLLSGADLSAIALRTDEFSKLEREGNSIANPIETIDSSTRLGDRAGFIPAAELEVLLNALNQQTNQIAADLRAPSIEKTSQLLTLLSVTLGLSDSVKGAIENHKETSQNQADALNALCITFYTLIQAIMRSIALCLPPALQPALAPSTSSEKKSQVGVKGPISIDRIKSGFQTIVSYAASAIADLAGAAAVFKFKDRILDAGALVGKPSVSKEIVGSDKGLPNESISQTIFHAVAIAAGSAANASFRKFAAETLGIPSNIESSESLGESIQRTSSHAAEQVLTSLPPIASLIMSVSSVQTAAAPDAAIGRFSQEFSEPLAINSQQTAIQIEKDATPSSEAKQPAASFPNAHRNGKKQEPHAAFALVIQGLMQWSIHLTENGLVSQAAAEGVSMQLSRVGSQGSSGMQIGGSFKQDASLENQPESIQAIGGQGDTADVLSQFLEQQQKIEDPSHDKKDASQQESGDVFVKRAIQLSEMAV